MKACDLVMGFPVVAGNDGQKNGGGDKQNFLEYDGQKIKTEHHTKRHSCENGNTIISIHSHNKEIPSQAGNDERKVSYSLIIRFPVVVGNDGQKNGGGDKQNFLEYDGQKIKTEHHTKTSFLRKQESPFFGNVFQSFIGSISNRTCINPNHAQPIKKQPVKAAL